MGSFTNSYSEQIALQGQDLPCTYLAQHELESENTINIILPTHIASATLQLSLLCQGGGGLAKDKKRIERTLLKRRKAGIRGRGGRGRAQ